MYDTSIGNTYRPHRSGGYAVERIFQENLAKSNLVTKVTYPVCTNYPTSNIWLLRGSTIESEIVVFRLTLSSL